MKTTYRAMAAGLLAIGLVSQAQANLIIDGGPFDGTDIGNLDTLVDSITNAEFTATYGPGGGEQNELDYLNDASGESYDSIDKTEDVSWYNVIDTNNLANTNIIAFQLASGFGHYLIKNAANIRVVFLNNIDYLWGAFDTTSLGGLGPDGFLNLGDDMQISHVSGAGTPTTEVSEPGMISLLALGLVAFGFARRRRASGPASDHGMLPG
ncbi:MAG TPA: PEP-CTERM sorting domain-containing protein [Woeseiaceae bacterium]|nr:PEP-CTERM sorting domain-containing protein [Woeseiaceae bacterium]